MKNPNIAKNRRNFWDLPVINRLKQFILGLSPDEYYRLDETKSITENAYVMFIGLSNKKTSDSLRLCFLNEIIKLFDKHKPISLGFTVEEFLYW